MNPAFIATDSDGGDNPETGGECNEPLPSLEVFQDTCPVLIDVSICPEASHPYYDWDYDDVYDKGRCCSGISVDGMKPFELARLGMGFVPEDRRIFPEFTVLENLEVTRQSDAARKRWDTGRIFHLFPTHSRTFVRYPN